MTELTFGWTKNYRSGYDTVLFSYKSSHNNSNYMRGSTFLQKPIAPGTSGMGLRYNSDRHNSDANDANMTIEADTS